LLPVAPTTSAESEEESATTTITTTTTKQNNNNVEYIHLFPFRNYNDWVNSAIKQQYDRGKETGCDNAKKKWENGKCQHYRMEIDLRKYGRVDLDRFQAGVVRGMKNNDDDGGLLLLHHDDHKNSSSSSSSSNGVGKSEERREEHLHHTFILYLHRDLEQVMKVLSTTYHIPMLPGTGSKKKGKRPEGTCNESLVELYHECFSEELMEFRWDLEENWVDKTGEE
jgi:hypothetical protein